MGRELILNQREDVVPGQLVATVQELQLDDECATDDLAAELLDETRDRLDGAARREHVVVDEHAGAVRDRVRVKLERILAVLGPVPDLRGEVDHLSSRRGGAGRARTEAAPDPARARRGTGGPPARPDGARGYARAEPGRRWPRGARPPGRPTSGTRAGVAAMRR